jgi:hypothetical protein
MLSGHSLRTTLLVSRKTRVLFYSKDTNISTNIFASLSLFVGREYKAMLGCATVASVQKNMGGFALCGRLPLGL